MKSKIAVMSISTLLLGACSFSPKTWPIIGKTYTKDEVAKHNNADDCWMIIDGGVYDVTSFIGQHPGGKVITFGCGKDASIFYHARGEEKTDHSDEAKAKKEAFRVGSLAQ